MADAWCPVCERESAECFRCDECGKPLDGDGESSDGQRSVAGGGR